MKRTVAIALMLTTSLASGAEAAQVAVGRDAQTDVMVTIYNGNLGLVKDVRETRLPTGLHETEFTDVAAQIDPTTVHLKSLHLGHNGRLVLPSLPENLVSKPTLVWLLRNALAGPQRVEASYLTGGITWKADYVMVLDAADATADLTGWVTIDNRSGATYANAALKLVAGDVNRAPEGRRSQRALEMAAEAASMQDAARDFTSEGFFEYHLYTLDGRTTVKDNQTKQLTLMSAGDVPVVKELIYYGAQDYYRTSYGMPMSNQKVGVYLDIKNAKEHRLGVPLPKGKIRVYKADASGSQQFVGEDWIDHTPKDERVKIKMGDAFDLVGERTQKDFRKLGSNIYEVEWEIALRNHKKTDQTVTVIEPVPGDWQVMASTHAWEKPQAHTLKFQIPVAKEGASRLTYRVRLKF